MVKDTEYHFPSIKFITLKKGMTEDELNDYMCENNDLHFLVYLRYRYNTETFKEDWQYSVEAACGCKYYGRVCWLDDWWEGQQDVEYLAITKIGEIKC